MPCNPIRRDNALAFANMKSGVPPYCEKRIPPMSVSAVVTVIVLAGAILSACTSSRGSGGSTESVDTESARGADGNQSMVSVLTSMYIITNVAWENPRAVFTVDLPPSEFTQLVSIIPSIKMHRLVDTNDIKRFTSASEANVDHIFVSRPLVVAEPDQLLSRATYTNNKIITWDFIFEKPTLEIVYANITGMDNNYGETKVAHLSVEEQAISTLACQYMITNILSVETNGPYFIDVNLTQYKTIIGSLSQVDIRPAGEGIVGKHEVVSRITGERGVLIAPVWVVKLGSSAYIRYRYYYDAMAFIDMIARKDGAWKILKSREAGVIE